MKTKVKKFGFGGAITDFSNKDITGGGTMGGAIGGAAAGIGDMLSGLGSGAPGSGLSQEAATGSINNADATPQDLLQSNAGAGMRKAIENRETGKAVYDGVSTAVAVIPGIGPLLSGAMKLGKGVKDMFTKEDEFGITDGQYRRNPELARTKETFGIGKTNAAINDMDVMGAQISNSTPQFNAPQFGKFGMKFKKFR